MHGHAVADAGGHLRAKLGDDVLAHRGLVQRADFRHVMAHRFLAIDVLAFLNGRVRNREVHVIRDGHVDRIDLVAFLVEQFAPVGIRAGLGSVRQAVFEVIGIDVAHGDDLQAGMFEKAFAVANSHAGNADAGVVELAVGRGGQQAGRQDERRGPGGKRGGLEEVSA